MNVRGAALAALACGACIINNHGGHRAPPAGAASWPVTAGDALLADVPAGANVLVELDVARLYANPTLGPIAKRAFAAPDDFALPGLIVPRGTAPLAQASVVVMAAYAVGTADASTVTLVATRGEVPGGVRISDSLVALGPPAMVARVQDTAAGRAPSVATDRVMMATRARAVPEGAPGATVRACARLDLDARVGLAPVLGPDLAPASLSMWVDVADDAALVAVIDGHDAAAGGGERLLAALERTRVALAGSTTLFQLGLAPAVKDARVERAGDVVRVVATIGPKRLGEIAAKLYPPPP